MLFKSFFNMQIRKFFLILPLLGAIALAGCSSSSSSNGPATVVHLNEGSTFTFVDVVSDSMSHIVSSDTTIETFAGVGFTLNGETDVDQLVDNQDGNLTGTSYIHYESNGDLSYLSPGGQDYFGALNGWWLFPFASQ